MIDNEYGIELEENMDVLEIEEIVHKKVKNKLFYSVYINFFVFYILAFTLDYKYLWILFAFGTMVIINSISTMIKEDIISQKIIEDIKKHLKYKNI